MNGHMDKYGEYENTQTDKRIDLIKRQIVEGLKYVDSQVFRQTYIHTYTNPERWVGVWTKG